MMPAELERLYRIRMSLPPAQRAQVEQEYEAYMASKQPQRASPTSLDPVEASAMDIPDDPETTGRAQAGLFANLPEIPVDDADRGTTADAGLAANLPPLEDPGITEEEVDARVRMVQQRGASNMFTPETQRAVARAALEYPVDPTSGDYSTPQFRAAAREAIARENQARAAAKAQAEAEANAPYEEGARQRANIQRLIRAGVNPMQDMTAPTPEQQGQFDNWARSGSVERMARYAPAEAQRRWDEGVAERHAEYMREQNDPEYKKSKRAAEDRTRDDQRPAANNALRRELQQMGIDTDQFEGSAPGDTFSAQRIARNQNFNRAAALDAKQKALNDRRAGSYDAVVRRAQLRQNPMEYLGRNDITDDQRMQAMFLLSGGKGASPNDVRALQEKMFLEGIQQGARANINVGNRDLAQQMGVFQLQQQNRAAAEQAAQEFFADRAEGMWNPELDAQAYDDLIALLQSYNLTPGQAAGIAGRYRRAPGRAESTAPTGG